jgi:hypothetical protein
MISFDNAKFRSSTFVVYLFAGNASRSLLPLLEIPIRRTLVSNSLSKFQVAGEKRSQDVHRYHRCDWCDTTHLSLKLARGVRFYLAVSQP